ncbi:hypothetical protein LWI28_005474 [Acer negundo]|uniref:Uncharacterized protein n=1 Tax=Acer negundo TaxID=4023 RepID=A0AAD5IM03_ACENE|nr:hypothetical protein LWI28_005474 [Acer negundo]
MWRGHMADGEGDVWAAITSSFFDVLELGKVSCVAIFILSFSRDGLKENTEDLFATKDPSDSGEQEVNQLDREVDPEALLPGREGFEVGYNSEEYFRKEMEHTLFAINQVRGNKLNATRVGQIAEEFLIPDLVDVRMLVAGQMASNPHGSSVAFHPAFLEIGARLPLHWTGGDDWWFLASYDKQGGEPLIAGLPSSNKEWKKSWFVASGNWGKDFQLGGLKQSVRSVFNLPSCRGSVFPGKSLWILRGRTYRGRGRFRRPRGIYTFLSDQNLHRIDIIHELSEDGFRISENNLEKKRKLTEIGKKRMEGKGKGIEGATKRRRIVDPTPPIVIPLDQLATNKPTEPTISLGLGEVEKESPPTNYGDPSSVGYNLNQCPIIPDNGIEFLCSYAKNMLRSREATIFGKMSTADRIWQSTGSLWQALGNLLDTEKKYEMVKDVNSKPKAECRKKHERSMQYYLSTTKDQANR